MISLDTNILLAAVETMTRLRDPKTPRRWIYDLRLGMSLVTQGITEFATVNLKDFQGIGFKKVWNPLR